MTTRGHIIWRKSWQSRGLCGDSSGPTRGSYACEEGGIGGKRDGAGGLLTQAIDMAELMLCDILDLK